MIDLVEYRHLKYFLAIADANGFRAAAEALHTSQPSLTKQMKDLESVLDVELFDRSGTRTQLTATGKAFVPIARELLLSRLEAIEAVREIDIDKAHSLKLGYCPFIGKDIFHTVCELLRQLDTRTVVCVRSEDAARILLQEIAEGVLDAALVMLPVENDSLQIQIVRSERVVACLRIDDPNANRASLEPGQVRDKLRIFRDPSQHPGAHTQLIDRLAEIGISPKLCCVTSNPAEVRTLVREGLGYGLVREGIELETELTTRPIAGLDCTIDSAFVYSKFSSVKLLPVLARNLKRRCKEEQKLTNLQKAASLRQTDNSKATSAVAWVVG